MTGSTTALMQRTREIAVLLYTLQLLAPNTVMLSHYAVSSSNVVLVYFSSQLVSFMQIFLFFLIHFLILFLALCSGEEWQCEGGDCISLTRRCDGRRDCQDGTDELDCPTQAPSVVECSIYEFECPRGEPRCISQRQTCDRVPDCQDGFDELDCPGCRDFEFTCGDGTCIDSWRKCDGRPDCRDQSDEDVRQCGRCRLGEFRCRSGEECIPERRRCDRRPDCRDGSDEEGCPFADGLNLRTYPTSQNITEGRSKESLQSCPLIMVSRTRGCVPVQGRGTYTSLCWMEKRKWSPTTTRVQRLQWEARDAEYSGDMIYLASLVLSSVCSCQIREHSSALRLASPPTSWMPRSRCT